MRKSFKHTRGMCGVYTWFVSKVSVLIFLFKCLLVSLEITSYLLQSMTLGKLHNGSNVFYTDHSSTESHFL